MNQIWIPFLALIVTTIVLAQEKSNFISMVDFDIISKGPGEYREDYATFMELQNWAKFQGWNLEPDQGPIQNGIARMVSPQGFRYTFIHSPQTKETIYLHIELTRYYPVWKEITTPYILRIYVNQKQRKIIEVYGKKSFQNPIIIGLDPSEFRDGRIVVEMFPSSPSTKGKFWGIWDMYLSKSPTNENWD